MNRQLFEHHPAFGYRFIPGLKARMEHEAGGYLIRANQTGFRCDHEFDAARQPGRKRVLLFGDSFTAGDGVSNKKRYGDQLEEIVGDLEVWNFGLSGSGTDQQYLIYREFAADMDCDLVVLGVLVENIRRVAARFRPYLTPGGEEQFLGKPYYSLEQGKLVLHQVPVPKEPLRKDELPDDRVNPGGRMPWLREAVNKLGPTAKEFIQRVSGYDPVPDYTTPDNPHWILMSAILERWIAEIKHPVILFPIPLYQHVEESSSSDAYRARFAELANSTDAMLHDPLDDILSYSAKERRAFRFQNDIHPTPAGHRALAESLAPAIRKALSTSDAS
ncbi:MAG TPA: hypothetical protein EYQ60_18055 [Myxococcales bacterium]|nr:hypothetical protein [Myxococcales bacterium]